MWRIFCLSLVAVSLYGQDHYRVKIEGMNLSSGKTGFFLEGLSQIETDGRLLYLASGRNTKIAAVDGKGKVVKTIGGAGEHPGEFGDHGVLSLAVQGKKVWGIDMNIKRVRLFENGDYVNSFALESFNITRMSPAANMFAFSKEFVVIPTNEDKAYLASVYLHDGTLVEKVGEPLEISTMVHPKVLGMNDTHWRRTEDGWMSVHKFWPLISFYDQNFGLVDQFQLETAHIFHQLDLIMEADPGDRWGIPTPVFSDVKFFRGDLWLISQGHLYQVDPKSHKIKSTTLFHGEGEDFAEVQQPNVNLYYFSFLEDGTLILGHPALLWNHDLWRARLPFLKELQKKS